MFISISRFLHKKMEAMNKIRTKLFLTYIVFFVSGILVVTVVLLTLVKGVMIQQLGAARIDLLNQISERSNGIKNSVITLSNLFCHNDMLLATLSEEQPSNVKEAYKKLGDLKRTYDIVFKEVGLAFDIVVLGNNGFNYASSVGDEYDFDGLKKQLWYGQIAEKDGEITFISSFPDVFGGNIDKYMFSASRTVQDGSGKELGTLMINIDEKYLSDLCISAFNDSGIIYIIDRKGNIVSHQDKSMLGLNFINIDNFRSLYGENNFHIIKKLGEDYLLSSVYDAQTGWTIISEVPCRTIFASLYRVYSLLIVVMGIYLILSLIVTYFTSASISKPLLKLCKSMDFVKRGDLDVISDINGYNEINNLKDSFNDMSKEIKRLLEDVQRREANKRQIELDFLRAQINPHFLYNTLFSIKCMIELRKNEKAAFMMSAFIELLKKTLSVDTDLITLEDEFQTTEKYFVLQQFRYEQKIHYECELDEQARKCMVPALILQPLVENAIFHGLEPKNNDGMIVVEAYIKNERLLITVSDDGVGMCEEKINELYNECNRNTYKRGCVLGIANVSSRIKINFGQLYGIYINSYEGIGTTITIELPVIWKHLYEGGVGDNKNSDSR